MMKSFARSLYRLRSNWPLFGPASTGRFTRFMSGCFMACVAVAACHSPAMAGTLSFFTPDQWTSASCLGANCTWNATSPAGAVTAASTNGWAICCSGGTSFTPALSNEFNVFGNLASIVITLPGSPWGTAGGEMILGNIHNGFEYNVSASDSSNAAINVNAWTLLGEDLNSTSSTGHCVGTSSADNPPLQSVCPGATTFSESFYVYDTTASAGSGQGGVLALGNLPSNVKTITVTLESINVGNLFPQGGQGSDFIILNVGNTPEPSTMVLVGAAGLLLLVGRRRSRRVA